MDAHQLEMLIRDHCDRTGEFNRDARHYRIKEENMERLCRVLARRMQEEKACA